MAVSQNSNKYYIEDFALYLEEQDYEIYKISKC